MTRYLVCSDIHINITRRMEDTIAALNQVSDLARQYQVNKVLILGDIYTSRRPHAREQMVFEKWIKALAISLLMSLRLSLQYVVLIIKGNHDEYPDGTHTLHPFTEIGCPGVIVYDNPMIVDNIFMGHMLLREAKLGPTDFRLREAMSAEELIKKYPGCACYLLGDVHKPQTILEDPLVIYAGSIAANDFGERDDAKRVLILDIEDGKLKSWESIQLKTRPMIQIDVDLDNYPEEAWKLVSHEAIREAIVKIVFHGTEIQLQKINTQTIRDTLKSIVSELYIETDVRKESTVRDKRVTESITPQQALELYVQRLDTDVPTKERILKLGQEIIQSCQS